MAIEVGDVVRVAVRQKWDSVDDVINVLHFEAFEVPVGGNVSDFMEDVSEHITVTWDIIEGDLANNLSAYDMHIYNVTQDVPYGTIGFGVDYGGGTGTGEAMPPYVGPLILFPTTIKRKVGRLYIGGVLEAANVDGKVHGTVASNLMTFAGALREGTGLANGSALRLVVWSRSSGLPTVPSYHKVQPYMAIQRRRKPGRGS